MVVVVMMMMMVVVVVGAMWRGGWGGGQWGPLRGCGGCGGVFVGLCGVVWGGGEGSWQRSCLTTPVRQAMAALEHERLVSLIGVVWSDAHARGPGGARMPWYIVMERAECSLDALLHGGGGAAAGVPRLPPLDARLAVRLIEDAAAGVAAIHARGYVHRDLKPANLLLFAAGGGGGGPLRLKVRPRIAICSRAYAYPNTPGRAHGDVHSRIQSDACPYTPGPCRRWATWGSRAASQRR